METALYRKYRPKTFKELIGQDIIVQALTNQIKKGKVSHAYLFTGSRGTGKTSTARILARAINCESPVDGNPCGKCAQCLTPTGANMDVIEIDAASNNGVDAIRELREDVSFLPSSGKYKVYIIDEVHMLTASAYNALLKTLEEPPRHVIFVLCTTNPEKISATILSRCMRFDFHLVSLAVLSNHLKYVLDSEGIKYDDKAISHIARLGEGSVRDMLSIADRCITLGGDLSLNKVLDITGTGRVDDCFELLSAAFKSNPGKIITKIEDLAAKGKSITSISSELASFARDVMLIKADSSSNAGLTEDGIVGAKKLAEAIPFDFLLKTVRTLGQAEAEIRYSLSPKTVLECALLSLCGFDDEKIVSSKEVEDKKIARKYPQKSREEVMAIVGHIRAKLDENNLARLGGIFSMLKEENFSVEGNKITMTVDKGYADILNDGKNLEILSAICKEKGLSIEIRQIEEKNDTEENLDFLNDSSLKVEIVSGRKRRN